MTLFSVWDCILQALRRNFRSFRYRKYRVLGKLITRSILELRSSRFTLRILSPAPRLVIGNIQKSLNSVRNCTLTRLAVACPQELQFHLQRSTVALKFVPAIMSRSSANVQPPQSGTLESRQRRACGDYEIHSKPFCSRGRVILACHRKAQGSVLCVPLNAAGPHCSCTHESHILRRVAPFSSSPLFLPLLILPGRVTEHRSLPPALFYGARPLYTRVYVCIRAVHAARAKESAPAGAKPVSR